MSYYVYLQNGVPSFTPFDQVQTFYSQFGTFYQQPQEIIQTSVYSLPWAISDGQCPTVPIIQEKDINVPLITKKDKGSQSLPPKKFKKRDQKSAQKQILSAKKNSQSNIINQFYSFFSSRQKSEKLVQKSIGFIQKGKGDLEKILSIFYTTIRFINAKRGRKYVNISMFLNFFTPEELSDYLPEIKLKVDQLDFLTLEELCEVFRRCSCTFLRDISIIAILTSKRISIVSKEEHLKKRRKIMRTILGN